MTLDEFTFIQWATPIVAATPVSDCYIAGNLVVMQTLTAYREIFDIFRLHGLSPVLHFSDRSVRADTPDCSIKLPPIEYIGEQPEPHWVCSISSKNIFKTTTLQKLPDLIEEALK